MNNISEWLQPNLLLAAMAFGKRPATDEDFQ